MHLSLLATRFLVREAAEAVPGLRHIFVEKGGELGLGHGRAAWPRWHGSWPRHRRAAGNSARRGVPTPHFRIAGRRLRATRAGRGERGHFCCQWGERLAGGELRAGYSAERAVVD